MRSRERYASGIASGMVIAWLLCGGAAPGATEPAAPPPAHADLHGTWTLNPDLTAQLARDQRGSDGVGGFHGGGGGGGRHRHGGGTDGDSQPRGGDRDADGGERSGPSGGDRVTALGTLVITEEGDTIAIADAAGHRRELHADGRKVRDESRPWGASTLRASWDADGDLQVEVTPDKGSKRTESYVVAHDRKHLYVTVTLAGGLFGGGTRIVHAYDPAEPPASPSPSPGGV